MKGIIGDGIKRGKLIEENEFDIECLENNPNRISKIL